MATAASLKFAINSTWDGSGVRKAREDIAKLANDVRELGNKVSVKVKVEPSMVGFATKVKEGAKGIRAEVGVDPNLVGFQRRLNEAIRNKDYTIKVSVVPDFRGLQQRLDAMMASRDFSIRVRVDYDRSALTGLSGEADRARASLQGLGNQASVAGLSFTQLVARVAGLVTVAAAAKVAVAGLAVGAFAPLITEVATATKLLAVVPAALAGIGLVAATAKIGMTGLGDAFKAVGESAEDFEQSIAGLAPTAQEFMRTINGLKGAWDDLTQSVQNELFEGVGESVQELADQHLPRLKEGFTGIADEMNEGILRQFEKLKDPAVGAAVDTLFDNIEKAVGPATDAIGDFAIGLGNIASAGSENLPGIAEDFADIAESFKEWTANSENAAKVKQWITDGWEALKDLSKDLTHFVIDTLPSAIAKVEEFGQKLGSAFKSFSETDFATDSLDRLESVFGSLADSASAVWPALKQIAASLAEASAAVGVSVWQVFLTVLETAAGAIQMLIGPLQSLATFLSAHQGLVNAAAVAWLAFKTVPAILAAVTGAASALAARMGLIGTSAATGATGLRAIATSTGAVVSAGTAGSAVMGRFGSAIANVGTHVPVIARMQTAFVTAAAGATTFGRSAGTAAAAMTGLRSAGSGLISALGGGLSAGLIAAGVALLAVSSNAQNAKAGLQALENVTETAAQTQRDLADAFTETAGAVNDISLDAVAQEFDDMIAATERLGATAPSTFDMVGAALTDVGRAFTGATDSGSAFMDALDRDDVAQNAQKIADELNGLGLSSEQMAQRMTGSRASFDAWVNQLVDVGRISEEAGVKLTGLRDAADQARNIDFNSAKITEGLSEISEHADDAASDLESLRSVLESLGVINVSAAEAMSDFEAKIDEIAEAAKAGADGLSEFSGATINAAGAIDLTNEAGRSLQTALIDVAEDFQRVATSGGDVEAAMANAETAFQTLSASTGIPIEKIRELAAQFGFLPKEIAIAMSVDGAGQVAADLASVALQMGKTPDTKSIRVDLPGGPETAVALSKLGFTVTSIPGTKEVKVTAQTATAKAGLDALLLAANQLELNPAQLKVFLDTAEFMFKKAEVEAVLGQLKTANATPKVMADVTSALSDMKLTMDELNNLDLTTASPEVIAIINEALSSLATVNSGLDETGAKRPMPAVGVVDNATGPLTGIKAYLDSIQSKTVTVTVNTVHAGAGASGSANVGNWRGGIAGRWKGGIAPKALPGHAGGYRLPTSGPGTNVRDGFLGVSSKGKPIANVDAGEWIINGRSSEKYNRALSALNRNNPMAAIAALQRHVGAGDRPGGRSKPRASVSAVASGMGGSLDVNVTVRVEGNASAETLRAAGNELAPQLVMAIKQGVGVRAKVAK